MSRSWEPQQAATTFAIQSYQCNIQKGWFTVCVFCFVLTCSTVLSQQVECLVPHWQKKAWPRSTSWLTSWETVGSPLMSILHCKCNKSDCHALTSPNYSKIRANWSISDPLWMTTQYKTFPASFKSLLNLALQLLNYKDLQNSLLVVHLLKGLSKSVRVQLV